MTMQEPTTLSTTHPNRPRALADINYNALQTSDLGTSSEDEVQEARDLRAEDARSVIGVSLGQAQTRWTSPKTASAEKAAAIDETDGFFIRDIDGTIEEGREELDNRDEEDGIQRTESPEEYITVSSSDERRPRFERGQTTLHRLPSPWKAGPKTFRTEDSRIRIRDGMAVNRKRANSGPSGYDGWHKAFMSNLSGFPRHFSLTAPFGTSNGSEKDFRSDSLGPKTRSGSMFSSFNSSGHNSMRTHSDSKSQSPRPRRTSAPLEPRYKSIATPLGPTRNDDGQVIAKQASHDRILRRSTSDHSLQAHRTLSRVSSLGDDSRFEHVQDQVNSRIKAIKDSLADSNIRMPSFPNMSSISLQSFKPEFAMARSNSMYRKSILTMNQRNGSFRGIDGGSGPPTPTPEQTVQHVKSAGDPKMGGPSVRSALTHPHFSKACAQLEGDVVILGGYRGSILRSAEPPNRQVWVPVKVGLNIRKVDLEVGLEPEDDERMVEKIIPGGMLTHIGPVDIARRLFKRLRASDNAQSGKLRVHDYGYDWRLDPNLLSRRLIKYMENLPCNKPGTPPHQRGATVIAHSLGGLITRHAINQRPDLFSGVIYAGTPTTCVNILGPLRNGDDVLMSSRVLTAQVNFTIRTSFALLPLDGKCFFNKYTKEKWDVDFFDVNTWIDYRLTPCLARPLPPFTTIEPTGISGIMSSFTSALPSIPGKRGSIFESAKNFASSHAKLPSISNGTRPSAPGTMENEGEDSVAKGNIDYTGQDSADARNPDHAHASEKPSDMEGEPPSSIATTVTLPRDKAIAYLKRTLASVKAFKQELAFRPEHMKQNVYPPAAVIYGKSTPTVYGAHVVSEEAIKHADAYDALQFASGDGVVLAKASMLPDGYHTARGGIVSSERGHVTLLGDLEAVGRALNAITAARKKGVGTGLDS